MKKLIALLLVVLLVAALFVGCADSSSNRKKDKKDKDDAQSGAIVNDDEGQKPGAKLEGSYELTKVNGMKPVDYFTKLYEEYGLTLEDMGIDASAFDHLMTLELKEGGAFTMTSKMDSDDMETPESINGTWKLDGDKVTLVNEEEPDDPLELTWKDGTLVISMDDDDGESESWVFEKK